MWITVHYIAFGSIFVLSEFYMSKFSICIFFTPSSEKTNPKKFKRGISEIRDASENHMVFGETTKIRENHAS